MENSVDFFFRFQFNNRDFKVNYAQDLLASLYIFHIFLSQGLCNSQI